MLFTLTVLSTGKTITTLVEYDIQTDMVMLDAGYVSLDNMGLPCSAGIEFVARLPEKNKDIYNHLLAEGLDGLKRPENIIEFNGRYVYSKQVECSIGKYRVYCILPLKTVKRCL